MQPTIDMARDKINEIITKLQSQYTDSKIRIAIVGYRDVEDKVRFEIFEFSESVNDAKQFLEKIKASAGGDEPEDVNGAFQKVLELDWKYFTRMVYHLADAPCHGTRFHNTRDKHPRGRKNDAKWDDIFAKLKTLEINYVYFDIGAKTKKMFRELNKIHSFVEKNYSHLLFQYEAIVIPKMKVSKDELSSYLIKRCDPPGKPGQRIPYEISSFRDDFVNKTVANAKKQQIVNIQRKIMKS